MDYVYLLVDRSICNSLTNFIVIEDKPAGWAPAATSTAAEKSSPVVTSPGAADSASSSEDELALEMPHPKKQVRIAYFFPREMPYLTIIPSSPSLPEY